MERRSLWGLSKYLERVKIDSKLKKRLGQLREQNMKKRLDEHSLISYALLNTEVKRLSCALRHMMNQGRSLKFIAKSFQTAATQAKQYGKTDIQIGILAWRSGGPKLVKALNRLGVCPRNPFMKAGRGTPLKSGQKCTPESILKAIGEFSGKAPWDLMVDEINVLTKVM